MLDVVFWENGLIEAEDKKDLKEKVIDCAKLLTDTENEGVKSTPIAAGKFAKYITDREKTVLRKLIQNVRRKTMRVSNKSVPLRLYLTNRKPSILFLQQKNLPWDMVKRKMCQRFLL